YFKNTYGILTKKYMLENFQMHPFVCPNCHISMKKKELYITVRWYGRKIHTSYFSKT
ncbi:hypothetical protein FUSO4_10555, partial [Fusobacterium necrophorum DJ-1]